MDSSYPKSFEYGIPGDLHLISRLRLTGVRDLRRYFDQKENMARKILAADILCLNKDRRPVRKDVLRKMKAIAYIIIKVAQEGKHDLTKGKRDTVEHLAYRILDIEAKLWSQPEVTRGAISMRAVSRGGTVRAEGFKKSRAVWFRMARKSWTKRPQCKIRTVARKIASETGDNFNTIRLAIAHLKPQNGGNKR